MDWSVRSSAQAVDRDTLLAVTIQQQLQSKKKQKLNGKNQANIWIPSLNECNKKVSTLGDVGHFFRG